MREPFTVEKNKRKKCLIFIIYFCLLFFVYRIIGNAGVHDVPVAENTWRVT